MVRELWEQLRFPEGFPTQLWPILLWQGPQTHSDYRLVGASGTRVTNVTCAQGILAKGPTPLHVSSQSSISAAFEWQLLERCPKSDHMQILAETLQLLERLLG